MKFPDAPTCHGEKPRFASKPPHWRDPELSLGGNVIEDTRWPSGKYVDLYRAMPLRTCSYCGSVHPGDLLDALNNGATLELADMKYGWPHKFYVQGIPSPIAGQTACVGFETTGDGPRPIMGPAPNTVHAKFYAEHLLDEGFDDEARAALTAAIMRLSGIEYVVDAGSLRWFRKSSNDSLTGGTP